MFCLRSGDCQGHEASNISTAGRSLRGAHSNFLTVRQRPCAVTSPSELAQAPPPITHHSFPPKGLTGGLHSHWNSHHTHTQTADTSKQQKTFWFASLLICPSWRSSDKRAGQTNHSDCLRPGQSASNANDFFSSKKDTLLSLHLNYLLPSSRPFVHFSSSEINDIPPSSQQLNSHLLSETY